MTSVRQAEGSQRVVAQRFMTLDGLRGIAAVMVVIFHLQASPEANLLSNAYLAVDFFFLLSGFVIGHAYEKRLQSRELSFRNFVGQRMLRLGPLLALGALIGVVVAVAYEAKLGWFGGILRAALAFPPAVLTLPTPWVLPLPWGLRDTPFPLNVPSWSLFFELAANFAFAAMAVQLTGRRLGSVLLLGTVALIVLVLHRQGVDVGSTWPSFPLGFIRVAIPFLSGIALHRVWAMRQLPAIRLPFWLLGILLIALLSVPRVSPGVDTVYTLAVLFLFFPLLIIAGCQNEPIGLWSGFASFSARLSYPMYILHCPLLGVFFLLGWADSVVTSALTLMTQTIVILVFSVAAEKFYDVPVRNSFRVGVRVRKLSWFVRHSKIVGKLPAKGA